MIDQVQNKVAPTQHVGIAATPTPTPTPTPIPATVPAKRYFLKLSGNALKLAINTGQRLEVLAE